MNALNRAVIIVLLLLAMVLCSVLLVGARWVLPPIAEQLSALVEFTEGRYWYDLELPGGVLACLVDLVLFLLILLQVRQPRKSIRVEKAGGEVLITIASITDRLKHEVNQLPDVLRSKPRVLGKRSGVVVRLDAEVVAGVNVPEKANQIVEVARRVVEDDMGLGLAQPPKVNLRAASYSKARKSPVKPGKAPPARPQEPLPVEPIEAAEAKEELADLPEALTSAEKSVDSVD